MSNPEPVSNAAVGEGGRPTPASPASDRRGESPLPKPPLAGPGDLSHQDRIRLRRVFNVPNQITLSRLVLSVLVFVLIGMKAYVPAIVTFLIAASTDWVDGYYARRYGQVTKLGRIFDPFVDKIIICGSFIYLAVEPGSGIVAWMAVLVVAREILVTAIRSFIEQSGRDFSANASGKLKMLLQCIAVVASLIALSYAPDPRPMWLDLTVTITVWAAVLSTIQSGAVYLVAAAKSIRE